MALHVRARSLAPAKRRIVLLSGMSGAGLSTALKAFEDLGYEAVDNLRLGLIPALIADSALPTARSPSPSIRATRVSRSMICCAWKKRSTRSRNYDVKLLFLECSDEALQQRFTETRRRHPWRSTAP